MTQAALIYPHQLFAEHPALQGVSQVVLVEEPLLFTQYRFHRQKLVLHRTTMMRYAERLRQQSLQVHYVSSDQLRETADIAGVLKRLDIDSVQYVDPSDDWLSVRLSIALKEHRIAETFLEDPHFLTPISEIRDFNSGKRKLFFTNFYIAQRKRLGVLLEDDGKPVGGKWSFDPDNRKKLPKGIRIPEMHRVEDSDTVQHARLYVRDKFPDAIGSDTEFGYPTDHESAAEHRENGDRDDVQQQMIAASDDAGIFDVGKTVLQSLDKLRSGIVHDRRAPCRRPTRRLLPARRLPAEFVEHTRLAWLMSRI